MRGLDPKRVGGYRVTDEDAMLAAMEAAGTARMLVEAQLSKVLSSATHHIAYACGYIMVMLCVSQLVCIIVFHSS